MPYPPVTQLETRLQLDHLPERRRRSLPLRRRVLWAAFLGVDTRLARSAGGRR
jgi:hypothetical protein